MPAWTVTKPAVNYYIIVSLRSGITEQAKLFKGLNISVLIDCNFTDAVSRDITQQLGIDVRKLSFCF